MDKELLYRVALTFLENVGDITAKKLVAYCGGVEAIFRNKKSHLEKVPGVGAKLAGIIAKQNVLKRAEEEIEFILKNNITPLFYLDEGYPQRLKHYDDAPIMLYTKGNINFNNPKAISIVGTRNATEYGKEICEKIVQELAPHDPLIISGLAYGIDICAHKAAVQNKLSTVAVLAHGLDRIYPSIHRSTAVKMLERGGLATDFPSGTNPDRENFPKRNRIVAGLCDAVLVIEAGIKGGALITAEIANSYNKDVFAIPGKIGDTYSEGCNKLIKINKAALCETVKDIEYIMGWELSKKKPKAQQPLFVDLNPEEETIVSILREYGATPVDVVSVRTNFTPGKTATLLLNLEFSGVVKSLPGKVYQLCN